MDKPLEVVRGFAETGIGEPSEAASPAGERYLWADPELRRDAALLAAIRPWMELDPELRATEVEDLEAWSCFAERELVFVARAVAAGGFGGAAAYFAHGRAWPAEALDGGRLDYGAHLGRPEVFDRPWRAEKPAEPAPLPQPAMVRCQQVRSEIAAAGRLLAHLYQALVQGYPLVIAAPLSDFVSGRPLPALVSFARAALPLSQKKDCRIRVLTRQPELFLNQLRAQLVAVPEDVAGRALKACPEATLLDRSGELRRGSKVSAEVQEYAQAVVRRAVKLPQGLLGFSRRISTHLPTGPPLRRVNRSIKIVFNLAFAFDTGSGAGDLLSSFLLPAANEEVDRLPWRELVRSFEWHHFPTPAVAAALLEEARTAGARELREALASLIKDRGLWLDDDVVAWWSAEDPQRLRILAELLGRGLITRRCAAECSTQVPAPRLAEVDGSSLFLQAELTVGILRRRAAEAEALALLTDRAGVLGVLGEATIIGELDLAWARWIVGDVKDPQHRQRRFRFARHYLREAEAPAWRELLGGLLASLRDDPEAPGELLPALLELASRLDPTVDLTTFLRLLELAARLGHPDPEALAASSLARLGSLEPEDRRRLVDTALDTTSISLTLDTLVTDGGELCWPWLAHEAAPLLASEALRRLLALRTLLDLGDRPEARGELRSVAGELDRRQGAAVRETSDELIRAGWWQRWREETQAGKATRRAAALCWLNSGVWESEAVPRPQLSTWKRVVADLQPDGVSTAEMRRLVAGRRGPARLPGRAAPEIASPRSTWPWIPPFQVEQLNDLCSLAGELEALAVLARLIDSDPSVDGPALPAPVFDYALSKSQRFGDRASPLSLRWLAALHEPGGAELPDLDLASAGSLLEHAAAHRQRILPGARRALAAQLSVDPHQALSAADAFSLWDDGAFLQDLADWMGGHESAAALGDGVAELLDQRLGKAPSRGVLDAPSAVAADLWRHDHPTAALFLAQDADEQARVGQILEGAGGVLLEGVEDEKCWSRLAEEIFVYGRRKGGPGARAHPLSLLAARVRRADAGASREDARRLAERSFDRFATAADGYPILLQPDPTPEVPLPALELAAQLLRHQTLGVVGLRILGLTAARRYTESSVWWRAFLTGLGVSRSGDWSWTQDCRETALALVRQATAELSAGERQAAAGALGSWERHLARG